MYNHQGEFDLEKTFLLDIENQLIKQKFIELESIKFEYINNHKYFADWDKNIFLKYENSKYYFEKGLSVKLKRCFNKDNNEIVNNILIDIDGNTLSKYLEKIMNNKLYNISNIIPNFKESSDLYFVSNFPKSESKNYIYMELKFMYLINNL